MLTQVSPSQWIASQHLPRGCNQNLPPTLPLIDLLLSYPDLISID